LKKGLVLLIVITVSLGGVFLTKIDFRSVKRAPLNISEIEKGKIEITPVAAKNSVAISGTNCCAEGKSKCTRGQTASSIKNKSNCGSRCGG